MSVSVVRALVTLQEVPLSGDLTSNIWMPSRDAGVQDGDLGPFAPLAVPCPLEASFAQTPLVTKTRIVGGVADPALVVLLDACDVWLTLQLPLQAGEFLFPNLFLRRN